MTVMDFLDPKKERRSQFTLLLGYCLVALAIGGATLVLLYQAYGYSLNQKGQITQNGLLFVSSEPTGSSIYFNNQLYPSTTNARVILSAGKYNLKVTRAGYHDWQRPIYVAGGDVQHFDYPFLFPSKLQTSPVAELASSPEFVSQSPDQRWILLDRPDAQGSFTLWDLKNPKQPVSSVITLPAGSYTTGDGAQTWAVEEWANDSDHVVLTHTYMSKGATNREYVLLDRQTPANTINFTYNLNLSQDEQLSLYNNQTNQVYVYDPDSQTLQRINVSDGTVVNKLQHVLAYKTYADKEILYITDQSIDGKVMPNQVSVVLQDGQQSYTLRTLPAGAPSYVLNLAEYSGDWYVAVAASNDSAVYVYKDPQSQSPTVPGTYPSPWRRLNVNDPSYIGFSNNTQFLMAESGQSFVVYDLENIAQYSYTTKQPLDQPQTHATWMDGDRIMYVSGGKLVEFDYDYRNENTLMSALPYVPVFDSSFTHVYGLAPSTKNLSEPALDSTWLLAPADQ
jgi:hypothetical protein